MAYAQDRMAKLDQRRDDHPPVAVLDVCPFFVIFHKSKNGGLSSVVPTGESGPA
jgi:hypothetical protein